MKKKIAKRLKLYLLLAILSCIALITVNNSTLEGNANEEGSEYSGDYSGNASTILNGNVPTFTEEEIVDESYEEYGELDELGRCTVAVACIGRDLMPTGKRGSIESVKPTGWEQNKFPGIIDSNPPYLYNRCHLIGYQLTGENDNERNLVTGTRYMNIDGMLQYENDVTSYIKDTGNHVMYRVTPDFEGDNLVCSGVNIEALSVEDDGEGICFNVYCYNVQPGVKIDYYDGTSEIDRDYQANLDWSYIANKHTKKFHDPACELVADMKTENMKFLSGTREELIEQGYEPCSKCNP